MCGIRLFTASRITGRAEYDFNDDEHKYERIISGVNKALF